MRCLHGKGLWRPRYGLRAYIAWSLRQLLLVPVQLFRKLPPLRGVLRAGEVRESHAGLTFMGIFVTIFLAAVVFGIYWLLGSMSQLGFAVEENIAWAVPESGTELWQCPTCDSIIFYTVWVYLIALCSPSPASQACCAVAKALRL